jgi:hypothetical protein
MQINKKEIEKLKRTIKKQLTETSESKRIAEKQKQFFIKISKQAEKIIGRKTG